MKEEILRKFFIEGKKQIEIADELNISKYKVSRVVTKDARYQEEKERRKIKNRQKNNKKTKDYIKKMRKIKREDNVYAQVQEAHIQASVELSENRKTMNNRAYRDWNSSAYKYDKKTESYILKKRNYSRS